MTMTTPPDTLINLYDAVGRIDQDPYNVMGVCIDHLPPTKSRGSDYTTTFTLHDPSWSQGLGMKFRFFNPSPNSLPQIQNNGDVVILRDVATRAVLNQPMGLSKHNTQWIVLSGSSIIESTSENGSDIKFVASGIGLKRAKSPTLDELRYAKFLVAVADSNSFKPPPKSTILDVETRMKEAGGTAPQRERKWQLIEDLKPHSRSKSYSFADIFGEVRKSWVSDYGRVELSLTDYTANKLLYDFSHEPQSRDGDAYGYVGNSHEKWPGPWGRMTINVLLFDGHADFARSQVREGMFILVKNCQIKLDPNGSKLEAACRGDREDWSKVNVIICNPHQAKGDERFTGLLKRRHEYEKYAKANGIRFGFDRSTQHQSNKRSAGDFEVTGEAGDVGPNANKEVPTKMSKKARKREKKLKQMNDNQGKAQTPAKSAKPSISESNQNVRCRKVDIPLKSIESILHSEILKRKTSKGNDFQLPYQNCCYKAKVRVVDYYPSDITGFSVPCSVTEYDAPLDDEETYESSIALSAAQDNPRSVRWEWRFFLVVEDAGPQTPAPSSERSQMVLLVAGQDGDYLINQEASDLRARPQDKGKLIEKLFHLWGDLQERKEAMSASGVSSNPKPRSRPFECLIQEYGVPLPRTEKAAGLSAYQRIFRLFGTASV